MENQTAISTEYPPQASAIEYDCVVSVYDSHASAEVDVRALTESGFDMQQLSIVGKDYSTEEGVVGFYSADGRMKAWAKTGAFWGGLWEGQQYGSALFVVPGVGPLFAAGPLVGWVVDALEESAVGGGMTIVGAGLSRIGIPLDCVVTYERQLKGGKFIVIAHGLRSQVEISKTILSDASHFRGPAKEYNV